MIEFMRAGGFGIWLVLLLGVITLVMSARFGLRPVPARLPGLSAMSWATVFAILSAVTSNFAMVMWKVPNVWPDDPKLHLIVMTGIAESLTPAILGSTILTFAWLMIAVGHRRATSA